MTCSGQSSCPGVHPLPDGDYLIIGRRPHTPGQLAAMLNATGARVGDGEAAVIVPGDVVRDAAAKIGEDQ